MQDPELYIQQLGLTVPCMMSPGKNAILDSTHRTLIGYETYFFADFGAKSRFHQWPEEYCGPFDRPGLIAAFQSQARIAATYPQ